MLASRTRRYTDPEIFPACISIKVTVCVIKVHFRFFDARPFSIKSRSKLHISWSGLEPQSAHVSWCTSSILELCDQYVNGLQDTVQVTQHNHSSHLSSSALLDQHSWLQVCLSAPYSGSTTTVSHPYVSKSLATRLANRCQGLFWSYSFTKLSMFILSLLYHPHKQDATNVFSEDSDSSQTLNSLLSP